MASCSLFVTPCLPFLLCLRHFPSFVVLLFGRPCRESAFFHPGNSDRNAHLRPPHPPLLPGTIDMPRSTPSTYASLKSNRLRNKSAATSPAPPPAPPSAPLLAHHHSHSRASPDPVSNAVTTFQAPIAFTTARARRDKLCRLQACCLSTLSHLQMQWIRADFGIAIGSRRSGPTA